MIKSKKLFDYGDIHSHVGGEDRVLSVDFSTGKLPELPTQAFTLGVHPWNAHRPVDWEAFEAALSHSGVVGIGEAGIDKLRGPSVSEQMPVFLRQVELSEKYGLPLVIHSVRANHLILELKKRLHPTMPWVIHGFRGAPAEARQLMEAGLHLSLGKRSNPEVAAMSPSPFIHFETDEEITQ